MALLEGHVGPVWSLSYSRGAGSLLASGGADKTLRLFSCPRGDNILEAVNDELLAASAATHGADGGGGGEAGAGAGSAGAGGSGGAGAGGAAAAAAHHTAWAPYQLLQTYTTQAMPVVYTHFSRRNLLLAGGPWTLPPKLMGSSR
jgi:WD40 repeat protein